MCPWGDDPIIFTQGGQLVADLPGLKAWRTKKMPLHDNAECPGVILLNCQ